MARSRFSVLVSLACLAVSYVVAIPARAVAFVYDLVGSFVLATNPRAVADLLRIVDAPALAFAGDVPIDAALANDQRHEAGLARLGTVRHR